MYRSAVFRRILLSAFAGLASMMQLGGAANAATTNDRPGLRPTDLARPRKAQLPTGGKYDHASQEMKGYNLRIADTGTATDEDQGQSTTFWDGETK
jgi:hypothetical protein